jgi:tetratricopeptide (TPR) repeat protein
MNNNLKICLEDYISECENPEKNYSLGKAYLELGQTGAATSFFMRAAERYELNGEHEYAYECLIKAALCFRTQGNRDTTVKSLLLTALNLCPERPEAYFNICKMHKSHEKPSDCYTFANFALSRCNFDCDPLRSYVDYPGKYGILYYKAVSCWWLGRIAECAELYSTLRAEYLEKMNSEYRELVLKDIASFNII